MKGKAEKDGMKEENWKGKTKKLKRSKEEIKEGEHRKAGKQKKKKIG